MADIEQIKVLRQKTGVSLRKCKKALNEADGDIEEAQKILREWGQEVADKRADKEVGEGVVMSYIHSDKKTGVLLDLRCETDFVAKGDDFQKLAHELCLQIAAAKPEYITEEDVEEEDLEEEREIIMNQIEEDEKNSQKPDHVKEKIVEGKMGKFMEKKVLMNQKWIKDNDKTIEDLIGEYLAKIGENIEVKRFTRYEI
ncbi:MAG: elongation factor Ts [Patescibacteria group bacterium]